MKKQTSDIEKIMAELKKKNVVLYVMVGIILLFFMPTLKSFRNSLNKKISKLLSGDNEY